MREDVLCILKALCHLRIVGVQGLIEGHGRTLALLVNVSHISVFRIQEDLCVVLEIDLHDLVAQTEHDGVLRAHPFLHVDRAGRVLHLVGFIQFVALDQLLLLGRVIILLKVRFKVLEQSYLFLQFFWVI